MVSPVDRLCIGKYSRRKGKEREMKEVKSYKFLISGIFVNILLLIFNFNCFAGDVDLDRIVVTPSRIEEDYADATRKVDVVTSGEIASSGDKDLSDALTDITSVNISNYGGLGASRTIRMRGSTAAQILVSVDGRPVNNPRDGEVDLSTLSLDNIEHIEVVHGPGSSLYGASAMGGIVNIITKNPPKENKFETEFTSSYGSFNTYIERLTQGGRLSDFGYIVTGEYETSEGSRDNSEYVAKDINSKFEYQINDSNKLNLNSGFSRSKLGTPGSVTSFDADDKQAALKNFIDASWSFKISDTANLLARVYHNYDRLEFMENTAGSIWDTALNKDIHTTKVQGYQFQLDKRFFEAYQAIFGFDYTGNLNDSTTSAKHEYAVRAVYLENKFDLFKRLNIDFGARIDDYSNFGTEINPSFSAVYKFNPDLKLRGSISRSFRAPTFNDLYWPDQGWAVGNPNLNPEKGVTGEVGLDAKINKYISSGISYYRSGYSQLINWVDTAGVSKPVNIGSAVIDGIEFENRIYPINNLEFDINYTFLRAVDEKANKYLVYQPRHKVDCALKYKDIDGFIFELKGQFTNTRYADALNTIKVKRFFVFGLNVQKKIREGLTCFVDIENILNRKYQVIRDYPMPGFDITGGVKVNF